MLKCKDVRVTRQATSAYQRITKDERAIPQVVSYLSRAGKTALWAGSPKVARNARGWCVLATIEPGLIGLFDIDKRDENNMILKCVIPVESLVKWIERGDFTL